MGTDADAKFYEHWRCMQVQNAKSQMHRKVRQRVLFTKTSFRMLLNYELLACYSEGFFFFPPHSYINVIHILAWSLSASKHWVIRYTSLSIRLLIFKSRQLNGHLTKFYCQQCSPNIHICYCEVKRHWLQVSWLNFENYSL